MSLMRAFVLASSFGTLAAVTAEIPPMALQNTGDKLPINTLVLQSSAPAKQAQASQDFSLKLIRGITEHLAKKMNRDVSEFQVSIENLVTVPALTENVTGPLQLLGMGSTGSHRLEGYFNLNLAVPTQSGSKELQAMGVLKVTGPVVIAGTNLIRGHKISASDIQVVKLPWRTLASGIPGIGESDLLGQRVRSLVNAGAPIHPGLLDDPLDVQPGDMVELLIQSGPGVMIRSRGVAKQEGRVGDTIKIEQPDTKKKLSAVVRGPKSVEVQL